MTETGEHRTVCDASVLRAPGSWDICGAPAVADLDSDPRCREHYEVDLCEWAMEFQDEVDRLWPGEDISGRAMCLAEEAGEVCRAITKRRHALASASGLCKGMTPDQWTEKLRVEVMQTIGVALSICVAEHFDPVAGLLDVLLAIRARESESPRRLYEYRGTCWDGDPTPDCKTRDGRPNWCDIHGARPTHIGGQP